MPTVFYNEATGVRAVVHGDDFTFSGTRRELEKVKGLMAGWYDIKDRGIMGSARNEIKEVTILGRQLRWVEDGIEYEADESHKRKILKMEGLNEKSKSVSSPAVKGDSGEEVWGGELLEGQAAKRFRSAAASLNYLGQDRCDIQFAVKEVCQAMAKPNVAGAVRIKRVARYLLGAGRLVWRYGEGGDEAGVIRVEVFVDSDWASGVERRSTSGGVVTVDGAAIKHWSRTQKAQALSSGEAEYYAIVTGSAEGLGLAALAEDLGWKAEVVVWTDSSAAKGVTGRRGLGRLRHVELKWLWVQEAVKTGRIKVKKVLGVENVADHLTKPKTRAEVEGLLARVGGFYYDEAS